MLSMCTTINIFCVFLKSQILCVLFKIKYYNNYNITKMKLKKNLKVNIILPYLSSWKDVGTMYV